MPTFTNVASTSATPEPGFTYANFAGELDAAIDALRSAALTVATANPTSENITPSSATFGYANGTQLAAQIAASTATSVTFGSTRITAADGSTMSMTGSAKVSLSKTGAITAAPAKLTSLDLGNDQGMLMLDGALKLDVGNGILSGRTTAITIAYSNDNPLTAAHEWNYVTLIGRAGVAGNLSQGLQSLSGKLSGVEWGTLSTTSSGAVSTQAAGAVSGLKIDAATLLSGLNSNGFNALKAGLYSGNDTIDGTAGDDLLDAGTGNDKVYGEAGNDTIYGGAGNDQLYGGAGNDTINGGAGNDKIFDDAGDNTITDTEGKATITLGAGSDTITTGAGNDKILAGDGANTIDAGAGNDNIVAGTGADTILAGAGNDKINAGSGRNTVYGQDGNDSIITGAGSDWINGGAGADKITGGGGADVFVFDNLATGGKDTIADFNAAEDVFAFDTAIFTALSGGIDAGNFVIGKVALDADDYLVFDPRGGKLYYDADGSGGGAAIQIAGVKGNLTSLGADNFADMDALLA